MSKVVRIIKGGIESDVQVQDYESLSTVGVLEWRFSRWVLVAVDRGRMFGVSSGYHFNFGRAHLVHHRRITFKMYPTRGQERELLRWKGVHQRLYNLALEQRISRWRHRKASTTLNDQRNDLTELARAFPDEFGGINVQSLQMTLSRVDSAFKHFFRRVRNGEKAGFPRFKSYRRYKGWEYNQNGWKLIQPRPLVNGAVRLTGIGTIRIRGRARKTIRALARMGKARVKKPTVIQKADGWWLSVLVVCEDIPRRKRKSSHSCGLDWGVERFVTLARDMGGVTEECVIENARHLKRSTDRLKHLQRDLARKVRGSKNWEKARRRLASLHRKVARQRHNYLHQVSAWLVRHHALIATEELDIRSMTGSARGTEENPGRRVAQKAGLNRAILDTSPGAFLTLLKTKAEEAGSRVEEVHTRTLKPSQRCHACWEVRPKTLSERQHSCPCGVECSRDLNSALVMLFQTLFGGPPPERELERWTGRGPPWCGGGEGAPSWKHGFAGVG